MNQHQRRKTANFGVNVSTLYLLFIIFNLLLFPSTAEIIFLTDTQNHNPSIHPSSFQNQQMSDYDVLNSQENSNFNQNYDYITPLRSSGFIIPINSLAQISAANQNYGNITLLQLANHNNRQNIRDIEPLPDNMPGQFIFANDRKDQRIDLNSLNRQKNQRNFQKSNNNQIMDAKQLKDFEKQLANLHFQINNQGIDSLQMKRNSNNQQLTVENSIQSTKLVDTPEASQIAQDNNEAQSFLDFMKRSINERFNSIFGN